MNMELSFEMTDEELEKLRKILTDGGVRHYILEISDNEKIDVVEYKEYEKIEKENQSLKKQLKEKDDFTNKLQATKDRLNKYDYERTNQQKEFVEWLEAYIEDRDKVRKLHKEYSLSEERLSSQYFILQQVLSKYKEIIGDKE